MSRQLLGVSTELFSSEPQIRNKVQTNNTKHKSKSNTQKKENNNTNNTLPSYIPKPWRGVDSVLGQFSIVVKMYRDI